MPEYECHRLSGCVGGYCLLQAYRIVRQLDGIYLVSLLMQCANSVNSVSVIRIFDRLLCA